MNTLDPDGVDSVAPQFSNSSFRVLSTPSPAARVLRTAARAALGRWRIGRLTVEFPDGERYVAGQSGASPHATLRIRRERTVREFLLRGDIGVGESYMEGDWDTDDLPAFVELALLNEDVAGDTWMTRAMNVPSRLLHAARRNTRAGSRRNIAHHYDLSNEFFALFLDPGMTYSSAIFASAGEPLDVAQQRKFARFGRALALGPRDHVLEIGCGWGSFARFAARTYGCRVTALTISERQHALASRRVLEAGLADRIDVRLCDYRDVTGRFSKIVSIEMLEAVGRAQWPRFFARCNEVLVEGGLVGIQVITVPDFRFEQYARRCDWIQKYIFPGGLLPSVEQICAAAGVHTRLTLRHLEDIGPHYAETLARWRAAYLDRLADVRALGLDERFIRMWDYYLGSCEGAFRARAVGNVQLVLSRAI